MFVSNDLPSAVRAASTFELPIIFLIKVSNIILYDVFNHHLAHARIC